MADGRHFETNEIENRHMSPTVRPITTKFGNVAHIAPLNFAMPLPAHTLHLLLCLRTAEVIKTKVALVFLCFKSHRFKTPSIKIYPQIQRIDGVRRCLPAACHKA